MQAEEVRGAFIHEQIHSIDELIDLYSDDLLRLIFSYVHNKATAEDLLQEVFVKCYKQISSFRGEANIKTWLYRIAVNQCKDYLKSWHVRKVMLHEKWNQFVHKSRENELEKTVLQLTEKEVLANVVMTLPMKYREIIYLFFYEDYSITEISEIISVNPNTVKTRLKRGKELVKLEYERRNRDE
ncbi:MAG TPA: sigma-70 family RNA polymerase sigma factor [Bacilli bacterium]|nr:sigma-70 family RNA polymerase sigma factor [Bacilli bacterium]